MTSERTTSRHPLTVSLIYFGLVFSAGFIFGVVRTLYVAPAIGQRAAEFVEAPFMLVVISLSAWFVSHRHTGTRSGLGWIGVLAAIFVLAADLLVGIGLRHMSATEVFFGRDLVAGSVYYSLVAAFAVLPYALWQETRSSR